METAAKDMLVLKRGQGDTVPACRIALSVGAPLLILLHLDHTAWGLYAAFGAFSSIYGKYVPTKERLRQKGIAGAVLICLVTLAAQISSIGEALGAWPKAWLVVLFGTATAALTSALVILLRLRPQGVVFFVFAATGVSTAHAVAPAWLAFVVSTLAVLWCLLLGWLFHYVGEANINRPVPRRDTIDKSDLARDMSRFAIAAAVSGSIATVSGIPSPYWAQVAAVAPLSETRRLHQLERGLHRIVGTVLGVVVAAFLFSFPMQAWQVVVWVIVLQFLGEMFVIRNYSMGLLFITPLALMMVHLANPSQQYEMLLPRISETAIGAVVGLAVVLWGAAMEWRWKTRS